jgi:hypothetical protein
MDRTITERDPFLAMPRITPEGFAGAMDGSPALAERPARAYWEAIAATGVDPLVVLAIFQHESRMGRLGVATVTKSWGNVKATSRQFGPPPVGTYTTEDGRAFSKYATWLDGCVATAARLAAPEWVYRGRAGMGEVFDHPSGMVWAPAGDRNDPAGYLASVLRFMNDHADAPHLVEGRWAMVNSDPERGGAVEAIVLHIADGTYDGTISWFRNSGSGVSAHFVVALDGRIGQCVPLDRVAWANGWDFRKGLARYRPNLANHLIARWWREGKNPNAVTVSIEHEGVSGQGMPEAQLRASVALTRWLCDTLGVPRDRDHILGHRDLDSVERSRCPGLSDQEWGVYLWMVDDGPAPAAGGGDEFYAPDNPFGAVPMRPPIWTRWNLLHQQGLALPMVGYPMAPPQDAGGRMIQRFERGWLAAQGEPEPWDVVMLMPHEIASGPS